MYLIDIADDHSRSYIRFTYIERDTPLGLYQGVTEQVVMQRVELRADYPKDVKGVIIPAVTNTTACIDGFFNGWKNWCINHAVDWVENITIGDFPDVILKAHQEYLRGYNAANGSGNSMCPIGENAAFCQG